MGNETYFYSNLDVSNSDELDESVSNMVSARGISNFTERSHYDRKSNFTNSSLLDGMTENTSLLNANGDGGSKISPEMVQAGIGATTAVVAGIQASKSSPAGQAKQELKNVCGRKPLFKKKKAKWQECVNAYLKSKEVVAPTPPPTPDYSQRTRRGNEGEGSSDGKILGMPKGLAIGLGVAIVLAIGTVITVKIIRARAVKVK